jgi:glycosyltransferase involved in cell wall biosynthesis
MRIAFTATCDFASVREFSGTSAFMAQALSHVGLAIEPVIVPLPRDLFIRLKGGILSRLSNKVFMAQVEPRPLRQLAREVDYLIGKTAPDWVFSYSSIPVAYLETKVPIAFWSDAVFDGMVGFYPEYSSLTLKTLKNGHRQEQEALSRCRLALYSSGWAAEGARRYYQIDASKVHVVQYGANIENAPTQQEVAAFLRERAGPVLKLLFIGGHWLRKGGDIAIEVARRLHNSGQSVELNIVGCEPPEGSPVFVKRHGFLRKDNPADLEKLMRLFSLSHFLVLPSRAETLGIVFAEACAYGVPCLASNVGGIGTFVKEGVNGHLLELDSFVSDATQLILELSGSPIDYQSLALQAYHEYQENMNWNVAALRVKALLEQHRG